MPPGASSREASARRSRMCPQRDTSWPLLPLSAASTNCAFCCASDPAGIPPSFSSRMPTCFSERREAAGISNLGLRPSSSSSWSGPIASSSRIVGIFAPDSSVGTSRGAAAARLAPEPPLLPPPLGIGWTTGLDCGDGAAGELAGAAGLAALGFSKPGGSSDSGESCAATSAEVNASASPAPLSSARFIGRPAAAMPALTAA